MATDDKHPLWRWVSPLVVLTAEISSILAFLGIVTSLILNTIRFSRWGLGFTDIASPSDIFLSGVDLAGVLIAHLVAVALLALPWIFASRLLPQRSGKFVLPAIAFAGFSFVAYRFYVSAAGLEPYYLLNNWFLFLIIAASIIFATVAIAVRRRYSAWLIGLQAVLGIAALFVPLGDWVYTRSGYTGLYVVAPSDDVCRRPLQVNWVGTSAIVASCTAARYGHTHYVVLDRPSSVMLSREAVRLYDVNIRSRSARTYDMGAVRRWQQLDVLEDSNSRSSARWSVFADAASIVRDGNRIEAWLLVENVATQSVEPTFVDLVIECDTQANSAQSYARAAYRPMMRGMMNDDDFFENSRRRDPVGDSDLSNLPWQRDLSQYFCSGFTGGDAPSGELAGYLRDERRPPNPSLRPATPTQR